MAAEAEAAREARAKVTIHRWHESLLINSFSQPIRLSTLKNCSLFFLNQVIAAEGEQKASRALREASEVIGDSPAALQLRYLQVSILEDQLQLWTTLKFEIF